MTPLTLDLNEYRFRTADTSGTLRLLETTVETTVRRNLSRWTYETPYASLNPHPIRMWTTPSSFWVRLGIGVLGVCGAIYELLGIEGRYMPVWMSPLVLIGASGLLWFAFLHRREECIIFSAETASDVVYYRNGPDAGAFHQFTDTLVAKIERHRSQKSGEP